MLWVAWVGKQVSTAAEIRDWSMAKWLLIAVIATIAAIAYLKQREAEDAAVHQPRPPAAVTGFKVDLTPFQSRINALGTLRAWESVDITSSVSETVVSLHFEDSDRVERGQLLVTLQQNEEQASLRPVGPKIRAGLLLQGVRIYPVGPASSGHLRLQPGYPARP